MLTAGFVVLTIPDHPKALPEYAAANHVPVWLTVLTISRDTFIVTTAVVIYFVFDIAKFPPTTLGKLTTFAEVLTVLLFLFYNARGETTMVVNAAAWATLALVVSSGIHYIEAESAGQRQSGA